MNWLSLPLLIALALFLLYAGVLFFRQDSLIFRPRREISRTPADLRIAFDDLRLTCEDGVRIHAWWVPVEEETKAVIYLHGSDGNMSSNLATLSFLNSLRLNVLMVDYPGYGRSEGRPGERSCYQAAEAAWTYVHQSKGFPAHDILLFGQSLGCAVSTFLAARQKCGGLVLQSGFSSIPDMATWTFPLLPARFFCRTRMDSTQRINQCSCPLLVLHSPQDEHIPIAQAERIYRKAKGPKKFVRFPGLHASADWRHTPEVRQGWEELLAGNTGRWEMVQ